MKILAGWRWGGACWNKRGERTFEVIRPLYYAGRTHCGISLGLFTVGFWK